MGWIDPWRKAQAYVSSTLTQGGATVAEGTNSLRSVVLRAGSAASISVVSQTLGLIQLFILLHRGAGQATDAYFYILAWSMVPIQVLLVGTYYPTVLRGGKLTAKREKILTATAACSTAAMTLGAFAVYRSVASGFAGLDLLALAAAVAALASIPAWWVALRESASGDPRWLSGITLLPSAFAIVALLSASSLTLASRVTAMVAGQAAGYVAFWLFRAVVDRRRLAGQNGHPLTGPDRKDKASVSAWVLGHSIVAYASAIWIQTAAAALPGAGLTTLGVITKIVAAGSTLVSSSVLPMVLNSSSSDDTGAMKFSRITWGFGVILTLSVAFIPLGQYAEWRTSALLAILWLSAVLFNVAMHRVAYRFHSQRFSAIGIAVLIAAPTALWLSDQLWSSTNLSIVLAAFISLDLVSGILYALFMRQKRLAVAYLLLPALTLTLL